ncbi:MAG: dicarboxylate/amino acid:cation symporter [Deltaproteobacteria bacterium]|nr:dicarboxylate/amino acid:cation symporter [Deltaproteobacteria bacterium]
MNDKATSPLRILVGFAIGIALAALARAAVGADHPWLLKVTSLVVEPAGKLFLRALLVCVVPLVASSLVVGVVGLGDLRKLGRVGAKTFALTLFLSSSSVVVGLFAANAIQPGAGLDEGTRARLVAQYGAKAKDVAAKALNDAKPFEQSIVDVIPDNIFAAVAKSPPDMLGLMLFALFFGVALALQKEEVKRPLADVAEAVFRVSSTMVQLVMKVAPIGVGCLLFSMTVRFGFELLGVLSLYVVTVIGSLGFHLLVVYGLVLFVFAKLPLPTFLRRAQPALLTAFSTSSSNATLPLALEVTEHRLLVPRPIASFVLTVGATANQNGTALFEGVTILFLAQVFGVELTLAQQATVLGLAVVAGIGTAGVPSASIPFVAIVLGTVGVPPEGIALVLGVDRLLDMCRTVVNVAGDMVCAVVIAEGEGEGAWRSRG